MAGAARLAAVALLGAAVAQRQGTTTFPLNFSAPGQAYEGVGALSGGGGVTRMLIDYDPAIQEKLLDYLFKPNYGASLQWIKVEIGGDTQSTEGTEPSHQHTRDDLNCTRGYEWGILAAAKQRNPGISTYGLIWGLPGWVGGGNFWSNDTIDYVLKWLDCAENTWGVGIDRLGLWNERYDSASAPGYTKALRAALDEAGFQSTRIVAGDSRWNVAEDMAADPEFAAAVDVIGVHYPSGVDPVALQLQASADKALWASEMWNLGVVNDWPGALELARNLGQHGVWGLSASIVWCLIYSWYAILPFSHGTNTTAGAGHALLTAAEPWSGHYELSPTLAAVAHHTQFAQRDWNYLAFGAGSGYLDAGNQSTYVTIADPNTPPGAPLQFSVIFETAQQSQPLDVQLSLGGIANGATLPSALHLWATTGPDSLFQQLPDVPVAGNAVSLTLQPGAIYSLTTTTGQGFPAAADIAPSTPFPFPYSDDFDGYAQGAYPKYTADEAGIFVVEPLPAWAGRAGSALMNNITLIPIAWEPNPSPFTLIGNENAPGALGGWANYSVSLDAALDPAAASAARTTWSGVMETCSAASTTQQFRVVGGDGATLAQPALLESVAEPGLCLGLTGATDPDAQNAAVTGLAPCAGLAARAGGVPTAYQWQQPAGSAHVVNVGTGNCLDVGGGSPAPGTNAVNWPCKPAGQDGNQLWRVQSIAAGVVSLQSNMSGLCVDLQATTQPPPWVQLCGRIHSYTRNGAPPNGYCLKVFASPNATAHGTWQLLYAGAQLANGTTPSPVLPGQWLPLSLTMAGDAVTPSLGGQPLAAAVPGGGMSGYGIVAFGSGWGYATWFDNLAIAA